MTKRQFNQLLGLLSQGNFSSSDGSYSISVHPTSNGFTDFWSIDLWPSNSISGFHYYDILEITLKCRLVGKTFFVKSKNDVPVIHIF